MRVHVCRHCGKVFPSYSDLRQHLDRRASGNVCATCGRVFTRRDNLVRHLSRCRPKPFVCTTCNSSFGRKWNLDHHKRTVQCGGPPQPGPAPKRRRIAASLIEDPLTPHRSNPPLMTTSLVIYETSCTKNGRLYARTLSAGQSRRVTTTG